MAGTSDTFSLYRLLLVFWSACLGPRATAIQLRQQPQQQGLAASASVSPLRVAVAVIAPYGVPDGDLSDQAPWHDAFAVLAHSVRKSMNSSKHHLELLAIVPDTVSDHDHQRKGFAVIGWVTRFVPVPVHINEVQTATGRRTLAQVLGEFEELKYYGAAFTEYDRVLIVDGDTLFLQPIDELLDLSPEPGMVGTYDYGMDDSRSTFPPVNSGFLLFTPSKQDFDGMVDVFREGDISSNGFRQSGTGWTYGAGSQGLLSYFYNQWAPDHGQLPGRPEKGSDLPGGKQTVQPPASRFYPVDRSVYNVIQTNSLKAAIAAGHNISPERVKVFHFTGQCLKPWTCSSTKTLLCETVTARWWAVRAEVEKAIGLPKGSRCPTYGSYMPMSLGARAPPSPP